MNKQCIRLIPSTLLLAASFSLQAAVISGQGTWETTLKGRDLNGDLSTIEAYYDTSLNITWLADPHYAKTSGFDSNGHLDWNAATSWTAGLNFNGITGWRLPGPYNSGVNTLTFEFDHLYYSTLGNTPHHGPNNTGPFITLVPEYIFFWTSKELYTDPREAFFYDIDDGVYDHFQKELRFGSWAVHDGDVGTAVSAVPVPAAIWLLGSGLFGLIGLAKRKK